MSQGTRTRFTAYISKYALTWGVFEKEVEDCFHISPHMVVSVGDRHSSVYYKGDWHRTREEAIAKADEMRLKKIASVQASLKKLENLKF